MVTAAQVKELRERTNVGMLACKKALEEAGGDMDQAIELLRKRGEAKAASKGERETNEGGVAVTGRSMVKVLCETDFVARNEAFIEFIQEIADKADAEGVDTAKAHFESVKSDKMQAIGENLVLAGIETIDGGDTVGGYVHTNRKVATIVVTNGGSEDKAKDVAMHVTAMNPLVAKESEVNQELIEKEMEIAKVQLLEEGKPEQIIGKILDGKRAKFKKENAAESQPFVKDPSMSVAEYLGNGQLVAFLRMEV